MISIHIFWIVENRDEFTRLTVGTGFIGKNCVSFLFFGELTVDSGSGVSIQFQKETKNH
jgi:hypothetical protein